MIRGLISPLFVKGVGKEEIMHQAIENGATSFIQKTGDPKAQCSELSKLIWQIVRSNIEPQSKITATFS